MELFSKRNRQYRPYFRPRLIQREDTTEGTSLIPEKCRNRIWQEITFLSSTLDYISRFLLVDDQKKQRKYLHDDSMKNFSLHELGYSFTEYFNFKEGIISKTDDLVLFDLIETLIVFSKDENSRKDVIQRFKKIF